MIAEKIRAAIKKRIALHLEDYYGVKKSWEEEVEILSRNIDETIAFFENDCTEDEFAWLSEVIEDVAKTTQSREFVDCLFRVAKKYPEKTKSANIEDFILSAEGALKE